MAGDDNTAQREVTLVEVNNLITNIKTNIHQILFTTAKHEQVKTA